MALKLADSTAIMGSEYKQTLCTARFDLLQVYQWFRGG
jgi:hypothetical protein